MHPGLQGNPAREAQPVKEEWEASAAKEAREASVAWAMAAGEEPAPRERGGAAGISGAAGNAGKAGAAGNTGAGGASGSSGAAGKGGTAGSTDAGSDAADASTPDASTPDTGPTVDALLDVPGDAGCPNVFGTYEFNNINGGSACGDLNEFAPQAIEGTTTACVLHFVSRNDAGAPGINGTATLGADGTFSNAALIEGSVTRTGCTGSWNAMESEMTVVCGTGSDECLAELRRTGP